MPVHVAGAVTVTCRPLFSDSLRRWRGSLSDYIDNPEASLKRRLCVVNKHLGEMRHRERETWRQEEADEDSWQPCRDGKIYQWGIFFPFFLWGGHPICFLLFTVRNKQIIKNESPGWSSKKTKQKAFRSETMLRVAVVCTAIQTHLCDYMINQPNQERSEWSHPSTAMFHTDNEPFISANLLWDSCNLPLELRWKMSHRNLLIVFTLLVSVCINESQCISLSCEKWG